MPSKRRSPAWPRRKAVPLPVLPPPARGRRLITEETRKEMKNVLREIQDGTFASEFMQEFSAGRKAKFLATRRVEAEHPLEKVGKELRDMMSWLKK